MIPWGLILRIVGPLLLVGVIWMHGYSVGQAGEQRKAQAELNKALIQARDRELQWQQDAQTITEVHQDELQNIRAAAERAVARLRDTRPAERLPETPKACAGASPAALAASDAAVAIGFGLEFDKLRAEYAKCKAWQEKLAE